MEAFKNRYNKKSISAMALEISKHDHSFDHLTFIKEATEDISNLEMKERVVQIAESLKAHLKHSYKKNVKILTKTIEDDIGQGLKGFMLWPYTYYIEIYGIDDFKTSMKGLYEITKKFTSEFGLRPFLNEYPIESYTLFGSWVEDPNEHVRRLVSEGSRPKLPWGKKINNVKGNLDKNLQLLETLKIDPSQYVRTSVANHMNDISWIDPALTLRTLRRWNKIKTPEMAWLVKRALRSLLKQGNPEALKVLGFDFKTKSSITIFKMSKTEICEGETFEISFVLKNLSAKESSFMIDYSIHYPKANGALSKKTFKLKTLTLRPREKALITKKVSFKKVTTRRYYPGEHLIEVQVNGLVKVKGKFRLS